MTYELDVETIIIPAPKVEEVKTILTELQMEDDFELSTGQDGRWYLALRQYEQAWGMDAEDLLAKLAPVLKGTPEDGQIIKHKVDDAADYHILVNGEHKIYEHPAPVEIPFRESAMPGEEEDALIMVKVIALGGGRAAVVGYPEKKG